MHSIADKGGPLARLFFREIDMSKTKECNMVPDSAKVAGACNWCGKQLPRNKDGSIKKARRWCSRRCNYVWLTNHVWSFARKSALHRDRHRCVHCGGANGLEVNHIVPLVGRGYHAGCCHHLSNLETVCKNCHVKITKRQRDARK